MVKMIYVSEQTPHGEHLVDIYSRLLDHNLMFLTGEIDDEMAENIVAQLFYLESLDNEDDIRILINSQGGLVTAGLAIYDAIQCIKCNISTICIGQAASMAAVILASGTHGKRLAFPDARVMIHQPLGGAEGQASDVEIRAKEIGRVKRHLSQIMVNHTGQPIEVIERDTDRDFFLNAEESVEYGLIDRIMKPGEGLITRK
ncbi:MAG: ATP-dependent Clp protease proteolytic subunit [ANME-2 cluster archaeon]|nr:ATP-dependent Clp protease proteolytic subunit [ANME-2 cluster archaeon]